MTHRCRLLATEYDRNYVKHKLKPVEKIVQGPGLEERIEEGQIDPRVASIPTKLDEVAEQLVHKHILDNLQSVYQVTYKNPWLPRHRRQIDQEKPEAEEKDLGSELLAYIHDLYFNPHHEKILAPSVTTKRILGYMRPKLLHGGHSTYQHTFGRTGATIIIQEHNRKSAMPSRNKDTPRSNNVKNKC